MYRIILKILMWILIIGFGCNFIMQTISYSFYKRAKHMDDISFQPVKINFNKNLTGYGYNLDKESDNVILFFGGSNYIAYNSVGKYAGKYNCPFISSDYYGTQNSKGKMNLKSMKQSAEDLYEWAVITYPNKKIIVIGHSYGSGIAAYLASVKNCNSLFLLAAYRDVSDLYNKMIPIFWGPAKIFISNNIELKKYAQNTSCKTYIIGSNADKTLDANLQKKVQSCYTNSENITFDNVEHENYLLDEQVINYINNII